MQQKETLNPRELTDISGLPEAGRVVAIDPGTKRVGVAVCDEHRIVSRPLPVIQRTSWKKLLVQIQNTLAEFDAVALVVGLPYNFDGTESEMSAEARGMAGKFALSLNVPVFLQDERATTYEARGRLWSAGIEGKELHQAVDSEAATIILSDFLSRVGNTGV
ncbi:MAG TPA: Holliday junction resolvase RuvX [Pyrinomonadaceae bacterium]|nr:Holliday junction resolvase RuvX [Pyrinomonadaceae bacterium]